MISEKAKQYAISCHRDTNHKYDDQPYEVHLQMVADAAVKFIHLIPEHERENVIAGCWVHDCIEDCRQTYNDVKTATNITVAELAYALTNEKGRNRKERANDKYYQGIRETPYAVFVKLCDRIANAQYSQRNNSKMAVLYREENPAFCSKLYDEKYDELFVYLKDVLEPGKDKVEA